VTTDELPRVLVVDDEADNLALFRRVFRREYDLTLAISAAEARKHVEKKAFDVVFSDFAMPGENGVAFLTYLRDAYPQTERILVTAHADLPEVRAAATAGVVNAVIIKPWEREIVARWVVQGRRLAAMRRGVQSMSRATVKKE
jgi:response regulator RpfG family c-di-GMP phosphodiesterase